MKNLCLLCLLLLSILGCNRETTKQFVSPPFDQSYDLTFFGHGGPGSDYGMELLEKGIYNKPLSQEQILEDFNILVTTLKSNHPGLYDYQSEKDWARTIKSLKREIKTAKNGLDEYRLVSKLIAAVADAHTYVMNPYYQDILREELLFPMIPTVNNNQIFIDGVRLKSINQHTEEEILEQLQLFANSDGNTLPYKNAFIEMEFPLKYFTFMDESPVFEIVLENGKSQTLEGKSYFESGLRPKVPAPSFNLNGKSATLKIESWEDETAASFNNDLEEMAQNSTLGQFVKQSMEKAIEEQLEHLIIDLRGNKGGKSGPAAILLRYLINQPFKYYSEISFASDRFPTKEYITNKELIAFMESEDAKRMIDQVGDTYLLKESFLNEILPQSKPFLGTLEVWVDKYSLSVSTDVVAILKKNREVKITGDEIGGSLEHYCAGNYIYLKMPNSGIEVSIPLQRLKY